MKNSLAKFRTIETTDDRPQPGHMWCWLTPDEWIDEIEEGLKNEG